MLISSWEAVCSAETWGAYSTERKKVIVDIEVELAVSASKTFSHFTLDLGGKGAVSKC